MKIRPVRAEFLLVDRRTDGRTDGQRDKYGEANSRLSLFCERAYKRIVTDGSI